MSIHRSVQIGASGRRDQLLVSVTLLDIKCDSLYGDMRRHVYIELPRHYQRARDGGIVGRAKSAMCGRMDA